MIEQLEEIDRWLVLAINSWNTPLLDKLMWIISGKLTWIPLYVLLVYLGFRKLPFKQFLLYFFCVVGSVALADAISSGLIKEMVMRYRPSHHSLLKDQLHFYEESEGHFYTGGMFGFVSSHAANFFALAFSAGMIMKPFYPQLLKILLIIAVIVCFSRIYLGVHYMSDLLGGALIGTATSLLIYYFVYLKLVKKNINSTDYRN